MDLFGPLQVKGMGGHTRKTFKSMGLMVSCLATGAVAIWAYTGYNIKALLLALSMHTISDKGSKMLAPRRRLTGRWWLKIN